MELLLQQVLGLDEEFCQPRSLDFLTLANSLKIKFLDVLASEFFFFFKRQALKCSCSCLCFNCYLTGRGAQEAIEVSK